MTQKLNIDNVTRGAIGVIASLVLPKDEEGLTVAQTAQYLNISVESLHQMRLSGKGLSCYRDGNRILYMPSAITAYIKEVNSKKSRADNKGGQK